MPYDPKIFKAYDVRGVYPDQIDEETIYQIGQAYAKVFQPRIVAVGRDVRLSGAKLRESLVNGLLDAGVNVIDIGIITTEMLYFAVGNYGYDGGLTVSASHNPKVYNGIKMVGKNNKPISMDSGLADIRDTMGGKIIAEIKGSVSAKNILDDYIDYLLKNFGGDFSPIKIVANANFGMAGVVLEKLIAKGDLPIEIIKLNFEPDGNFPKGKPDPLLPENRTEFLELIKQSDVDFGVAWDADADRCFFATSDGEFIESYYIINLLTEIMLKKYPQSKIVYDPRVHWATLDKIKVLNGTAIISKAGHSFIKEKMREKDAVFAGETSGHYYFKDYFYCDNGMIPFLLIAKLISETKKSLKELIMPIQEKYFLSGEINIETENGEEIIEKIKEKYNDGKIEEIDGLSVDYPDWRFNIRPSNTEPLIRLNIESRKKELIDEKKKEILELVNQIK